MAKKRRRLSVKMKRTLRITAAVLFLVSAVGVALIPQRGTEAAGSNPRVTLDSTSTSGENNIPYADPTKDEVYTTGDGLFQFCYLEKSSGGNKVAVIVGYDYQRTIGVLEIPQEVDGYKKYRHSLGTTGGYVAVGRNGEFLYYPIYEEVEKTEIQDQQKIDPATGEPVVDSNGDPEMEQVEVKVKVIELTSYRLCYYSEYDTWINAMDDEGKVILESDGQPKKRDPEDFYYLKANGNVNDIKDFAPTVLDSQQRMTNADVAYIANQHVEKKIEIDSSTNEERETWEIKPNETGTGIFSRATNITKLIIGKNLLGIGDYAFYNCANLQDIEFGNGLNTIGNYAFAECINLKNVTLPTESSVQVIGDHAFYNCQGLTSFTVPVAVRKIGDSAFEGCASMTRIDLKAEGQNVALKSLGDDVFKDCKSLEYIEFPSTYSGETLGTAASPQPNVFNLGWLNGCKALKYIQIPNENMKVIVDNETGDDNDFVKFQNMVPEEFYFEGESDSRIHTISKNKNFAFKYIGEERYEKVQGEEDNEDKQAVFQVNNENELISSIIGKDMENVVLPSTIGPYKIRTIKTSSFQNKHKLVNVTIPACVEEIEPEAFKGCHSLKMVTFAEGSQIRKIGDKAFATQIVAPNDNCPLENPPQLSIIGTAELDDPVFDYAMKPVNNINNENQTPAYITFYTGWPTNLKVRYNPETDKNELIDYLSLEDLNLDLTSSDVFKSFPYIKDNQVYQKACLAAYKVKTGTMDKTNPDYTEGAKKTLDNAVNMMLPNGVESVKEGLISGKDFDGNTIGTQTPDTNLETFTSEGLHEIDPYMFKGCTGLVGAFVNGITDTLGDYAFDDCANLVKVDIKSDLNEIGKLPFRNCDKLVDVDFGTNPNFECVMGILFENRPSKHSKIIEVLEGRGKAVGTNNITAEELEGVNELREEAFKDCEYVMSADFSKSNVKIVPESCFENTSDLNSIKFNNGLTTIKDNAFKDSAIRYLELPNSLVAIANSTFDLTDPTKRKSITIYCEPEAPVAAWASNYDYITVSDKPITFNVYYYDEDGTTLLDTVTVNSGQDAKTDVKPTKPGFTFKDWYPEPKAVLSDMKVYARYTSDSEITYTVTFLDHDDTVLSLQTVKKGQDAVTPVSPTREGYDFMGWRPGFSNVQGDITTYAQYEKIVPNSSDSSDSSGGGSGSGGSGGSSDGGNGGNNNGPGGTNASGQQLYTVVVLDGSGSGSYVAGATVIIAANTPPAGKAFDKWVVDSDKVTLASTSIAATTFVMPSSNVTVAATYKDDKSATGSSSGGSNSSNTVTTTKPNTTVTITKPGISNEGLASATVSGSTDNFVLKISESATAKKEVEDALEAQYGSTKNLKYLAMDISLYDSTGKNKIENRDDLKVTITMPIPDDLIPYAGNNRVAYVINGKLVEISPKFTTINGVSCITFVAPHFSPYTIYVDTTNLTAVGVQDYTPKTGDGISPKWFLAAALLCISAFLFIKKDKKPVKVKAE